MLGGIVGTVMCGGTLNTYGCVGVTVEAEEHELVGINGGVDGPAGINGGVDGPAGINGGVECQCGGT
jgi:hypothetical protein